MRVREALSVFAGVALMALATAMNAQGGPSDNPDVNEVRNYTLTLDKAQKAATAMQSINQLIAANPSLNAAMDQSANTTGKETITQQAQSIDSRFAADHGISAALQSGLNIGHDGGLILDEQHGHRLGFEGR